MVKKNIGHAWFNGRAQIGIVMCLVDGLPKAYISTILGLDEAADIQHISEWGSKFPIPEAASVIKKCGEITDFEAWKEARLVT
jgi:hypothetical protein